MSVNGKMAVRRAVLTRWSSIVDLDKNVFGSRWTVLNDVAV